MSRIFRGGINGCLNGGFFAALMLVLTAWVSGAEIVVHLNGQQIVAEAEVFVAPCETRPGLAFFETAADRTFLSEPGQPELPFQVLHVMLPPNANLKKIGLSFQATYVPVEGNWQVGPVPPVATRDENGNEIIFWPPNRTIVDGFDAEIYGTNDFWPAAEAGILSSGQLRGWKMAEISVPLFRYNPVTGQLLQLADANVTIDPAKENKGRIAQPNNAPAGKGRRGPEHRKTLERARKLAINFDQAAAAYVEAETSDTQMQTMSLDGGVMSPAPTLTDTGYVIITTNAIRNASTKLNAFVAHKQARGFTVSVITETQYGTGSGDTAANNIRAWLQNNYQNSAYGNGGILYALLIGDPRTNSSSVPMKMCISDHPTDYFYAELTSDWDADGDGIYGETEDTTEKYFEIYVGRIPYYGSISDTDSILQKTINYENATDTQWRRRALLPMVPLDGSTPAYQMGEQIKYNQLEPRAIASTRIYEENYGLNPSPEHTLKKRYPATEWSEGIYGMMIWQTHGWDQGAAEIITTGDTSKLNNDYPSAVFQGSCATGQPETVTNLGYSILKNGGIGTIAASRNGWYYVGQTSFTSTSSVGGIGYQYARRLAEQKTLGQAIYDTKESLSYWQKNYFVYNLYGDPSVVVMPDAPVFTVTPTHGLQFHATYQGAATSSSAYTLKNNGAGTINWTAEAGGADWYTLSSSGGTIGAQGTATVTIALTNTVRDLPVGKFSDTIVLTDHTNGIVEERTVTLQVHPKRKIAHWHLDETSGTTVTDAAGAHHGELVNTTFDAASTGGKFGRALQFDGTDDHIAVPGFSEDMTGLTLSAWIHATDWSGNRRIMQKGGDGTEYRLLKESSRFVFEIGSKKLQLTAFPATGQWVHVVATYDGATMRVYYNKVLQGSTALTGPVPTSRSTLFIGTKNTGAGGGDRFYGLMDDVRIYNYAKDEAGIEALYNGSDPAEPVRPYDGEFDVSLVTDLQWMNGQGAVQSDLYLGTDYNAVVGANTSCFEYKGRQTATTFKPATLMRHTDYFWRIDQVDAQGGVTYGPVWRFTTGLGQGGITRQVWYNISGNNVTHLTGHSRYPDSPDLTGIIDTFEGPKNFADNYGSRIHGFFIPPTTGNYTFWIASDDYSELWLSPTTNPAHIAKIAWVNGATGSREWTKYPSQVSTTGYPQYPQGLPLIAGKPYYIMALHKEGSVGDNIAVAFSGPGIPQQVIDGKYLMPYAADYNWGPLLTADKLYGLDALEGYAYHDSVAGKADALGGGTVTWSKAAGPLWLQVAADGTLSGVPGDRDKGPQSFEIRAADANGAFNHALLLVNVHDTFTGQRGLSDFAGIAAQWLAGGCSDNPACGGADLTGDGAVDTSDLAAMADLWLMEKPYAGLASRWTFDADASDDCGNKHGVLMNEAFVTDTDAVFAVGQGALSLGGVNGYVEVPGFKGIAGGTSRTCSAWIKTEGLTSNGVIVSWGKDAAGQQWLFGVFASGQVGIYSGGPYIMTDAAVADGKWHHVAAVLYDDGSPSIDEVRLYIDGVLQKTTTTSTQALNTTADFDLCIGTYRTATGQTAGFFKGLIDEVQLHDRALTGAEIAELALRDLQLYLQFDENSGATAADQSVYGRHAQFSAAPSWNPDLGIGGAVQFSNNVYAVIPDWKGIVSGADRTCSAWVKTSGTGANMVVINWGTAENGKQWLMGFFSTGQFAIYTGGSYVKTNAAFADNQWHHIAAVLTDGGSASLREVLLYVDGVLQDVTVVDGAIDIAVGQDVSIGAFQVAPGQFGAFYSGLLDEIMVYSRPLTSQEIVRLANP
jgi:hypothetical protein